MFGALGSCGAAIAPLHEAGGDAVIEIENRSGGPVVVYREVARGDLVSRTTLSELNDGGGAKIPPKSLNAPVGQRCLTFGNFLAVRDDQVIDRMVQPCMGDRWEITERLSIPFSGG